MDLDPMNDGSEARIDQMTPEGTNYNNESEETSFGPWMIVSRRRGRGGGRGGARGGAGSSVSRAAHAEAPAPSNGTLQASPRSGYNHSTRGSFSSRGRGGHLGSLLRASGPTPDQAAGINGVDTFLPSQDMGTIMGGDSHVPRDNGPPNMSDPGASSKPFVSSNAKLTHLQDPVGTPPTLRTSEETSADPIAGSLISSHAMVVEQVSDALNPPSLSLNSDLPMSNSDGEESEGEDEDSEMSDYEGPEEPDDCMTLDQFQSGLRKETLVRRVPQHPESIHKKGRMDQGVETAQGLGASH